MNTWELEHIRFLSEKDYTLGCISGKMLPHALFVLEDEWREVKVKGETCIPSGRYQLGIRNVDTALTMKYRGKYPWFEYHIEIRNVPNFSNIYQHIGNTDEHTDGCQLIAIDASLDKPNGWVGRSTEGFKTYYQAVYPLLRSGDEVWITIHD